MTERFASKYNFNWLKPDIFVDGFMNVFDHLKNQ